MPLPVDKTVGDPDHTPDHNTTNAYVNALEVRIATLETWMKALGVVDATAARKYGSPWGAQGNSIIANGAQNRLCFVPIPVFHVRTFVSMRCDVRSAAGTGGRVRIGLYTSASNGWPQTLLEGSAQFNVESTGDKIHTFSPSPITLQPGLYWGASVLQGNGSPTGNFQSFTPNNYLQHLITGTDTDIEGAHSFTQEGVSGALPATFAGGLGGSAELGACITLWQS